MLLVMPGLDEDGESSDDDDLAVGDANGEDGDVEKPPAGLTGMGYLFNVRRDII